MMINILSVWGGNFDSIINDLLEAGSMNNDFGKLMIAVLIIFAVTIFLAIKKGSFMLIFLTDIILILFFTSLGWFPYWTFILLGIGVSLLIFMFGNGGGSGD